MKTPSKVTMTVGRLRKALEAYPEDMPIVLSRDSEGNEMRPVYDVDTGLYVPDNDWCGNVVAEEDEEFNRDQGSPRSFSGRSTEGKMSKSLPVSAVAYTVRRDVGCGLCGSHSRTTRDGETLCSNPKCLRGYSSDEQWMSYIRHCDARDEVFAANVSGHVRPTAGRA